MQYRFCCIVESGDAGHILRERWIQVNGVGAWELGDSYGQGRILGGCTQHVSEGRSRLIGTGLRRVDPGAEPMYE